MMKKRITGIVLSLLMALTLIPTFAMTVLADGADDQEFGKILYDGEEVDWAFMCTLDDQTKTISLEDLKISVVDDNKTTIAPENYDLSVKRTWWDDEAGKDMEAEVTGNFGVYAGDAEAGFTEYVIIATYKEGSPYEDKGETRGHVYVTDRHSLNWICADISMKKSRKEGWRMHDRLNVDIRDLKAPVVKDLKGTELTEGTDYSVTWYRLTGDPDADWDAGIIKGFEDYLVMNDQTKLNGLPWEPGKYFFHIKGMGDYYGETTILLYVDDRGEFGQILYDGEEVDWAYMCSVNDKTATIGLEDLKISVVDDNKTTIAPENYDLSVKRTWWDDEAGRDMEADVTGNFGVYVGDAKEGFTEYVIIATYKEGSPYEEHTETRGHVYVMDRHSLNWICADVSMENSSKDGWRMHDRLNVDIRDLKAPVVKDSTGTELTEGTDYSVTWYRLTGDPDADWDAGIIKGFEDYLVMNDQTKLNGLPAAPGKYFFCVDGKGDYYGEATLLLYVNDSRKEQTITTSAAVYDKTYGNPAFRLGAKTSGDGKLTYRSSNAKVAVLSATGVVTIKGAGTATITISAAETASYKAASKKVTVKVNKAANPLKVANAKRTAKGVSKKNVTVAGLKVSKKGQGKMTYTKVKVNKLAKNFKVNKKTGKITVTKGTKPGKYKVTISAKAAGDSNYNPSKTPLKKVVTVTVKK